MRQTVKFGYDMCVWQVDGYGVYPHIRSIFLFYFPDLYIFYIGRK